MLFIFIIFFFKSFIDYATLLLSLNACSQMCVDVRDAKREGGQEGKGAGQLIRTSL